MFLFKCTKPIILLLGGSDKGYSYDVIFENLCSTKAIIAFGGVREKIIDCAMQHNYQDIYEATNLRVATLLAKDISKSGDIVLLSPANASFDEFSSYAVRGEIFKEIMFGDFQQIEMQ